MTNDESGTKYRGGEIAYYLYRYLVSHCTIKTLTNEEKLHLEMLILLNLTLLYNDLLKGFKFQ